MAINKNALYTILLIVIAAAPFVFPNYGVQLATLWLFIIVAMTWDMTGGQMGYNSLGNIFFYGTGICRCGDCHRPGIRCWRIYERLWRRSL